MKKLLLNSLLMLTGFAAYSAEESKGEPSQTETLLVSKLPELPKDVKEHIISFLPQNHLQQLLDANLINPKPTLNKTLELDPDFVDSIAYSPDGSQLASGSHDNNTIKIWDTATGACLHTLTGHTNTITSIAYRPDGSQIASGSRDNTVKIWNSQTGECLRTLTGHTNWITSIAYSPDGSQIASGSDDQTIKIWNIQTGTCLHTFTGHTNTITSIAYRPDGSQIASGSWDNTVKIWNVPPLFKLSAQQNALLFKITQTALAWHNQGRFRRLQFKNPEDIETYATFPEELQEILKPVVVYARTNPYSDEDPPVNSHSNETEHGTAHATSASSNSKK